MAKKILVVDDEPGSILLFESILKKRGYQVVVASDGDEAIRRARAEKPDLIILDIMMPKVDGTEVAMTLREDEITKKIPIFFITALIAPGDKVEVAGTESHPVFAKPVNLNELLAKIQSQIGL
jgi:CheY-like chemotaxis protein